MASFNQAQGANMMDDQARIDALIAHYGAAEMRAEYDECCAANQDFKPAIDIALDEFIATNEGSQYDSGSADDEAICDQIDRCAPQAAAYIIGEWTMRDFFGPSYPIAKMRQYLDYGDLDSAGACRELQYAQIILALAEFFGPCDICEYLDEKALINMRADIIAGKLDAWIYWEH